MRRILLAGLSAVVITLMFGGVVSADTLGQITQYDVPSASSDTPYDIVQGSDGLFYFTQETGRKVWKYNPATTQFTSWGISREGNSITKGPDGAVWFTESGRYGKVTPEGTLTEYEYLTENVGGSIITYSTRGISTGPDGRIWLVGSVNNSLTKIFRINADGTVYASYTIGGSEAMETAPDFANNLVWYVTRAGNNSKIGRVDMSGAVVEWTLPAGIQGTVFSLTSDSGGKMWFTGAGNKLGNVDVSGNFSQLYNIGSGGGIWKVAAGLDGYLWATLTSAGQIVRIDPNNPQNTYFSQGLPGGGYYGAYPIGITAGNDGNMWFAQYYGNKIGKIGTGVSGSTTDSDSDGLTKAQELLQGTSDLKKDTDGDGLSDYVESRWYPNRQAVFCGTECAYPHPLQKDVFVEVDWMGDNQPNQTQISKIRESFTHRGINIILDSGQYGGGNQVAYHEILPMHTTVGSVDFSDLKFGTEGQAKNFNYETRYHIWRYMILGDKTNQGNTVCNSGVSPGGGDDDMFIAAGRIKNHLLMILQCIPYSYLNVDDAISGTMMHELGHSLCLTNPQDAYSQQPAGCTYTGIDTDAGNDYSSVMNYRQQMSMVDYSSTTPYIDWDFIQVGDFVNRANNDNIEIIIAGAGEPNARNIKKDMAGQAFKMLVSKGNTRNGSK